MSCQIDSHHPTEFDWLEGLGSSVRSRFKLDNTCRKPDVEDICRRGTCRNGRFSLFLPETFETELKAESFVRFRTDFGPFN